MSKVVQCPTCQTYTVELIRLDPHNVQIWRCKTCYEVKRWCPTCDQGWIRKIYVEGFSHEIFSCDECDATWESSDEIIPPGQGLETFMNHRGVENAWQKVKFIHEFEKEMQ
jgi:ribosomal protein L37AE/L43A